MKRILIGSLSLFTVLLTTVAPVKAETEATVDANNNSAYRLTARELVSLARRGNFTAQGIPSKGAFNNAARLGKINAVRLIETAIANNRLPQEALSDASFVKEVDNHLKSGGCGTI